MSSSWQDLRRRLDARGFRPSKRLGQNFLIDPLLARAIADELETDGRLVVEVGSGPGSLTRKLVRRGPVLAVEVDARLAAFLREESAEWDEAARLELLESDVLGKTPSGLSPAFLEALDAKLGPDEPWYCISNLPYASAGPFVAGLVQCPRPPRDGVLLTQWEFGERLAAPVGTPEYGTLSIQAQLAYRPRIVRRVPPEVFRPRPRVDSSLLSLGPAQAWLETDPGVRQGFGRFLQAIFAARRKVLRGGLALAGIREPEAAIDGAGLPPEILRARPAELAPEEHFALYEAARGGSSLDLEQDSLR